MLYTCKVMYVPRYDDDEVHDVPKISHVAVLVQDESQCEDLGAHLYGKYDHENGFEIFLQVENGMSMACRVLDLVISCACKLQDAISIMIHRGQRVMYSLRVGSCGLLITYFR